MQGEIIPTDSGWQVRISPRAVLPGFYNSYVKAERALVRHWCKSAKALKDKRKVEND